MGFGEVLEGSRRWIWGRRSGGDGHRQLLGAAWGCEKGTAQMAFLGMAVSGGVSAPGEAHLAHKRVLPGGESVI